MQKFVNPPPRDPDAVRALLDALEMPREGVLKWMAHERAFCEAHGGEKAYPELMALFRAVDEAVLNEAALAASTTTQTPSDPASVHKTTFRRHPSTVLRRWWVALKRHLAKQHEASMHTAGG